MTGKHETGNRNAEKRYKAEVARRNALYDTIFYTASFFSMFGVGIFAWLLVEAVLKLLGV